MIIIKRSHGGIDILVHDNVGDIIFLPTGTKMINT